MKYPDECPVFEIISECEECNGLHTTGAPTQYGGRRIDVYSCCFFEPYELCELEPITKAAKEMYVFVDGGGCKYPGKAGCLPV